MLDRMLSKNILPISMKKDLPSAPVGRPRAFDPDLALEKAMQAFWKQGYEGTSLSDLTEAMGINRPSLYATYGNKEELFFKVLDRYSSGPVSFVFEALKAPTARAVVEQILDGAVAMMSDPKQPRGCMGVQGILCSSAENERVRQHAITRRLEAQKKISDRFIEAQKEGDLAPTVDACDLARYLVVLVNGMSIQAVNGATGDELKRIAEFAKGTLPI